MQIGVSHFTGLAVKRCSQPSDKKEELNQLTPSPSGCEEPGAPGSKLYILLPASSSDPPYARGLRVNWLKLPEKLLNKKADFRFRSLHPASPHLD